MSKLIRTIFMFLALAILGACGGGGGSPGNISGGASLFTSAGASFQIAPGQSQTYTIGGGVPGYRASSSSGAASVTVSGNTMTVTGGGGGTATIVVSDSKGATVTIAVTVGSGLTLFTTAPSTITLPVGASSSVFTIGGGSLVYQVASSDVSIATVGFNSGQFIITGVSAGKVTISVTDSIGGLVTITVTIGTISSPTPFFTTASSTLVVAINATSTFTVGGGSAPYNVSSSNTSVVTASVNGTKLSIQGLSTGTANVLVSDSNGTPITISVSVGAGTSIPLFTSAPSTVTVGQGGAPNYSIGGGTAPYTAGSSNIAVATATVAGSSLIINGVSTGTATIVVTDNAGVKVPIVVTVLGTSTTVFAVSPLTSAGYVGDTLTFLISGGSQPYTVTSSNSSIATVTSPVVSGNGASFSGFLAKVGSVSIVVVDATGAIQTISATAAAPVSNMLLSPNTWSINETNNSTVSLNIKGGNGPFQVFTSNSLLSSVSGTLPEATNALTFDGTTVNVAVGSQGTRCVGADTQITITVKDSSNQSATSTMTIVNQTPGC
ncbi:hypothetical protein AAKU64_004116 [Undibacterium sp. GrIS 1.8]|uniref:beta strand repeat-containing protein n=1 Tax=unclassified Undibacterium TaxID=2630295 RepID=UPI00339A4708